VFERRDAGVVVQPSRLPILQAGRLHHLGSNKRLLTKTDASYNQNAQI